ncbi:MAG TPA: SNF2-related protein, partial [Massilibacterium sp.]|nr:SNF2-related protein [Massilibacterium sp.]
MEKGVIIEVDEKHEHFLMTTPFHLNNIAQCAPNRKFIKSKKKWFLHGLTLNARYIRGLSGATFCNGVEELIEKILKRSENKFIPFPQSFDFKTEPKSKQLEALNHAWGKKGFVFSMEMGTGKTKIYIDLVSALYQKKEINSVVLLTKKSVCKNTVKEINKHCALSEYFCLIPEYKSKSDQKKNERFIHKESMKFVVAGLESLSVKENGGKAFSYLWDFMRENNSCLVVDESHLIKNPLSNRAKNVFHLAPLAKYRYAGTGTLLTNSLLDLYSPFQFINPDAIGIGNYYSFKNRYTIKGGFEGKEIVGYKNVDELMNLIKPWSFQTTKEEMVDLPPKIHIEPIQIEMTKEQKKVYNDIKKNKVAEVASIDNMEVAVQSILQVYLLLQQICAGFVSYYDDGGKRISEWIVQPDKNPKNKELISILDENPNAQFNI